LIILPIIVDDVTRDFFNEVLVKQILFTVVDALFLDEILSKKEFSLFTNVNNKQKKTRNIRHFRA
jgi:hypothetical protein